MLDLLTGDEQRFDEILVRAWSQGIEFYGRGSMSPGGISFEGRRLIVLITDGDGHVVFEADATRTEPGSADRKALSNNE